MALRVLALLALVVYASATMTMYQAYLNSQQAETTSTGQGFGWAWYDDVASTVNASMWFTGLGSNANAAHIHGPAVITTPAASAAVVWPWSLTDITAATAGMVLPKVFSFSSGSSTPVVADFIGQKYYFNLHTVNVAGGEIRGEIYQTTWRYSADLNGAAQIPTAVTTHGRGRGWATLDPATKSVTAQAWWWGTTGAANLAHIHAPAPLTGTANPIVTFTIDPSTTAAYGFTNVMTQTLSQANFDAITSGQAYFNIHTPQFGAGELRGQIWMAQSQAFTAGTYGYSCKTRSGGLFESLSVNLAASGSATVSLAQFAAAGCPNSAMVLAGTAKLLITSPGVNQYRQRIATPMDKMVQYAFSAQFIGASAIFFTGCEACAGATTIAARTKYTVDRANAACTVTAAAACPVLQTSYGNMLVTSGVQHIQMSEADTTFATGDAYTDLTYSDSPIVSSFTDFVPLFGSASAVVPSIVLVFASIIAVLMF